MSQRALQKAASRSAILRSAVALLRERGIAGMSVERAMAGAGLTVGAFYAHFADKSDLIASSFIEAMDEIDRMMTAFAQGRNGKGPLLEAIRGYLSSEHRDDPLCPMPSTVGEAAASASRPVRVMIAQGFSTMTERLMRLGGGAISEDRALALAVLMVGGQVVARATRGSPISERVLSVCLEVSKQLLNLDKSTAA